MKRFLLPLTCLAVSSAFFSACQGKSSDDSSAIAGASSTPQGGAGATSAASGAAGQAQAGANVGGASGGSTSGGTAGSSAGSGTLPSDAGPSDAGIPMIPGYTFEWSDEFDGPNIDESIWTIVDRPGTSANQELQYYTARKNSEPGANAFIQDGALVIEARQEAWMGFNYTSARLNTLASPMAQFKYGRMEARAKLPEVAGMWPAFWMEGINEAQVGWPVGGEIDIMEGKGRLPNFISGALHRSLTPGSGGDIVSVQPYTLASGNYQDTWHVFAVEWDNQQIRWYVDSALFQSVNRPVTTTQPWPFDQPFYFLLNLAVGGVFDSGVMPPANMPPQQYIIDYVRVYQQTM
ncbi:MAG TPA: glycoside hydrolase family 16 protein [Polyangiaceae bacterium]|jgi:beta-glucanase (GH16 family)|nr:glycoside hydrolase family 16 protein [Polyangiaceae bacterium]